MGMSDNEVVGYIIIEFREREDGSFNIGAQHRQDDDASDDVKHLMASTMDVVELYLDTVKKMAEEEE